MADTVAALLAGLLGGILSGALSGVLVFEYQNRRQRQIEARDAIEAAVVALDQVILLTTGGGRLTAQRRVAMRDLLGELGRGVAMVASSLPLSSRRLYQSRLLRLGDECSDESRLSTVAPRVAEAASQALLVLRGSG